jgi:tRNA pseudouridine55 synthase
LDRIRTELASFSGAISQVPPQVSAVKIHGERSYRLAKSGETVVIEPRTVTVHEIELLQATPPEIEIRVACSRGTYIRSIARDLGARLGWGGTLAGLVRTGIGSYNIGNAFSVEEIVRRRQEFGSE